MSPVLDEARRFLWRHGCAPDITTDPIDLIRDLAIELEKHEERVPIKIKVRKKPKGRNKPK